MTGLVVSGVAAGTCSITCPVDGQDFVVMARPYNCNPKTAEQWAELGCVVSGSPNATTMQGIGAYSAAPGYTHCAIACPVNGGAFRVTYEEATCDGFSMPVGVTPGDLNGCYAGIVLKAAHDKHCTLKCKAGYTHSSGKALLRCGFAGGAPTTDLVCT